MQNAGMQNVGSWMLDPGCVSSGSLSWRAFVTRAQNQLEMQECRMKY